MDAQDTTFYVKIKDLFTPSFRPTVMGILNITPDSFFDGGNYQNEEKWSQKVTQMVTDGADIIDIGAYSSRPNADNISEEEEINRLIPAIQSVREQFPEILISADTFRAEVAKKAVQAGANIINDISGGSLDENMFPTIAQLQVPYILMHMKGTPSTMQENPQYNNVTEDIISFFRTKIIQLNKLGVNRIIIDPGFGFGKTLDHNYQLLNRLESLHSLNAPILIGVSRKSMIHKLLNTNTDDALNGTSVVHTLGLQKGARLLRVHDVKEAKEAVVITEKMKYS